MAERASIFELVQFGPEVTPGTAVAASKRLQSLELTIKPDAMVKMYTGRGAKFAVQSALVKESVAASVSGFATYTDLAYVFNGVLNNVAPTGAGAAKTWVHAPDSYGPDTIKTYTIEAGSSVRAISFPYAFFTGATLNFGREECTIDANMIGRALTDGITLTATPTAVALVPLTPVQVQMSWADTQAGLAAAVSQVRWLKGSWGITNKAAPVWAMPSALVSSSYAAHVESKPQIDMKLILAADAAGMGLLTNLRANTTKWVRIKATSNAMAEGVIPYSLTVDTPVQLAGDPFEFTDNDGIYAVGWNLQGVHDATWGKACEVTLVTTVAAL